MPKRISRRERRRRLYYLRAILNRPVFPTNPLEWPALFNTDVATLTRWLTLAEPIPEWIPALAIAAYRIGPPPPEPRIPRLVRWILLVVAAGAGAVLGLARLAR